MPAFARHGMRSFDIESLPRTIDLPGGLRGFPALVDEGDTVGIRICETAGEQAVTMLRGTRRLLRLTVPSPRHWVAGQLGSQLTLALTAAPHGTVEAAIEDATTAALDSLIVERRRAGVGRRGVHGAQRACPRRAPADDARRDARARSNSRGGGSRS